MNPYNNCSECFFEDKFINLIQQNDCFGDNDNFEVTCMDDIMDDKLIDDYEDVITTRYSREELRKIFSETNTVHTWRRCWVALAESEYEL